LSGFTHQEVDTLIDLLTRLVIAADSKQDRKSRLQLSDVPIAKPVPMPKTVKTRKAS